MAGAASCLRWTERTEAESRQKINILNVICLISIEAHKFIFHLSNREERREVRTQLC